MSWHIVTDDKAIYQCLDYNRGAWHVGVNYGGSLFGTVTNRNSICIEMCVNAGYDYEKAFQNTVAACRQVMKDLNIPADHVYQHYDVCAKNCPSQIRAKGDWARFKKLIGATPAGTQASEFAGLTEPQAAAKILEMVKACDASGILWSVTAAQMILESGYVKTDLARNANNCFGMKCSLSGNTWESVWDGKSSYLKRTAEQTKAGETYYVTAAFRKYPCIEDSIKDHSLYLLGAMNGTKKRYEGLTGCKTYREAITLIKAGGYATDVKYVDKICNIIERFGLDKFDTKTKAAQKAKAAMKMVSQACEYMDATMRETGAKWGYYNSKTSITFAKALADKNYRVNCATTACWALKLIGAIPETVSGFYGQKDGSVRWKTKATQAAVEKACDVIDVGGKITVAAAMSNGTLRAGDIVTYKTVRHTNVYLGNGKWFDSGHAYADRAGDGATWKSWIGDTVYATYPIGHIIRLKTNSDIVIEKEYRVQEGAYKSLANAEKQAAKIRKAGIDCIVKLYGGNYVTQCGVFSIKANAEAVKKRLKAAGFNAAIEEM